MWADGDGRLSALCSHVEVIGGLTRAVWLVAEKPDWKGIQESLKRETGGSGEILLQRRLGILNDTAQGRKMSPTEGFSFRMLVCMDG